MSIALVNVCVREYRYLAALTPIKSSIEEAKVVAYLLENVLDDLVTPQPTRSHLEEKAELTP
jgi:hypothetical protein